MEACQKCRVPLIEDHRIVVIELPYDDDGNIEVDKEFKVCIQCAHNLKGWMHEQQGSPPASASEEND